MKAHVPGIICAIGLGAALMYLLDPDRGTRRRAMLADRMIKVSHKTRKSGVKTVHDLRNRILGTAYALISWGRQRDAIPDIVVGERVRSKLGSLVRHARSIEVSVDRGHVILNGSVGSDEVQRVLDRLARIPGVSAVTNHLDLYDTDNGTVTQAKLHFGSLPANTPASRFLTGTAGGILALYSLLRQRSLFRIGTSGLGMGLLALSVLAGSVRGQDVLKMITQKD